MKKWLIGAGVLAVLVAYSFVVRGQQHPKILPPTSMQNSANSQNQSSTNSAPTSKATTAYKDGTYTGKSVDAYYGLVQIAVMIGGGKITNVNFLRYPNTHETSVAINQQAMPYLKQEAIQAQSANVNVITGATFTSQAFAQSLQSALSQASNQA